MWCSDTKDGALLNVRAAPRSGRAGVDGLWGEDALRVRVRAAPVDGKANRELVETVADALGLAKSAVTLVGGETSKTKRLRVTGLSAAAVGARLGIIPGNGGTQA